MPGALKVEYHLFRQQEIHQAMRNISVALRKEFPKLKLNAAVWGAVIYRLDSSLEFRLYPYLKI